MYHETIINAIFPLYFTKYLHSCVLSCSLDSSGVFVDSLTPALDAFGLDGVFKMKEKQHEGLTTFYRRSGLHVSVTLCFALSWAGLGLGMVGNCWR